MELYLSKNKRLFFSLSLFIYPPKPFLIYIPTLNLAEIAIFIGRGDRLRGW